MLVSTSAIAPTRSGAGGDARVGDWEGVGGGDFETGELTFRKTGALFCAGELAAGEVCPIRGGTCGFDTGCFGTKGERNLGDRKVFDWVFSGLSPAKLGRATGGDLGSDFAKSGDENKRDGEEREADAPGELSSFRRSSVVDSVSVGDPVLSGAAADFTAGGIASLRVAPGVSFRSSVDSGIDFSAAAPERPFGRDFSGDASFAEDAPHARF